MDRLDAAIEDVPYAEEGSDKLEQHIIFTINGIKLPPIYDFGILFSYKQKLTLSDIFTCSCGNSGCAGWFYGASIKNRKHTTEWRILDDKEQRDNFEIKRFYSFTRENYDAVCLKLIKLIVEIEHKKITLPIYQYDDHLNDTLSNVLRWYHRRRSNLGYQLLKKEYEQMKALLVPIGRTPVS